MKIRISIGDLVVFAALNDSHTAKFIWEHLPLEAKVELWGDEVYFYIEPKTGLEKEVARQIVELGDVAYWPQGPCFCIFFGMTPNSRKGEIRPASAVNVFGKLEGDPRLLARVKESQTVRVERA